MSLGRGSENLASRYNYPNKDRSHSESPSANSNFVIDANMPDGTIISSADIYSWKLRKDYDGTIYAVYCVHVSLKCGFKWIVERRYSQFRDLRREILRIKPELKGLPFPPKYYLFNLSKSSLDARQKTLNIYLSELISMTPQMLELSIFLEVDIRLANAKSEISQKPIRRSLSFGSLSQALSIKDFHLIKVLGKGSFGKVYLVRPHQGPQSEVYAMKVLRKQEVIKRHQVEHTLTERYILANIRHPFLLSLRHAFQTPDKLYMVTDYCPGGELFFHLKRMRKFSEGMMRFYSAQIAIALAHLHQHDVVYRDLKPENVLLDQQGNVKLTDFGLSKRLKPSNNSGLHNNDLTFCGTPEYLSPEMILHRKNFSGYGKEVDWWSLGIVCFELITGWPPFYDRDFNRMCEKILYRPLNFPTQKFNITRDAEDLIRNMLQRDPNRRVKYQIDFPVTQQPNLSPVTSPSSDTSKSRSSTNNNIYVLQNHPFYSGFDWEKLLQCRMEPPFIPPRPRDISDTCNFDKEFTKLSVKDDSPVSSISLEKSESSSGKDPFKGFSFSLESKPEN